jgi:hypothetical protein
MLAWQAFYYLSHFTSPMEQPLESRLARHGQQPDCGVKSPGIPDFGPGSPGESTSQGRAGWKQVPSAATRMDRVGPEGPGDVGE